MTHPATSKHSRRLRLLTAFVIALLALPAAALAMPQRSTPSAPVSRSPFPLPPVHRDIPGTDPATATPTAVRVVRNITVTNADTTLPTVLAAVALAIALTGVAYVTLRLRPAARRA